MNSAKSISAALSALEPRLLFVAYSAELIQPAATPGAAGGISLSDTFRAGNLQYAGQLRGYALGSDDDSPIVLAPLAGDSMCTVADVNLAGQVVGTSGLGGETDSATHAVVWNAATGRASDLGAGQANAINSNGYVVGSFDRQAAIFLRGGAHALADLGGDVSAANDINDRNVIVGTSQTADGMHSVPYINDGRRAYPILPSGVTGGYALGQGNAINNHGWAVGSTIDGAFLYKGGVSTLLSSPASLTAAQFSTANDINDVGEIVGSVTTAAGQAAVLWTAGGTAVDLNTLVVDNTVTLFSAVSVDNQGEILAYGNSADGPGTFVLTPQRAKVSASGTLSVAGTDGDDSIAVSLRGSKYRVSVNGLTSSFASSRVKRINIVGLDGDDSIAVSLNITRSAVVDAGAGDDTVNGGSGPDSIFGNDGNDYLLGNGGGDTLVGGNGFDSTDNDPDALRSGIEMVGPYMNMHR